MTTHDETDVPAAGLLSKVRAFADSLDAAERELFAVLIGPGVESLLSATSDDEVAGFSHAAVGWKPGSLRERLATAATNTDWQLVERR